MLDKLVGYNLSLLTGCIRVYGYNIVNSWLGTEENWLGLCLTSTHLDYATAHHVVNK